MIMFFIEHVFLTVLIRIFMESILLDSDDISLLSPFDSIICYSFSLEYPMGFDISIFQFDFDDYFVSILKWDIFIFILLILFILQL